MPAVIGGKATSTVSDGITGTSTVSGDETGTPTPDSVVDVAETSAGAWIAPIVGGTVVPGGLSSSDWANPKATSDAATTTPMPTMIRVVRVRRFGSTGSTTTATLST